MFRLSIIYFYPQTETVIFCHSSEFFLKVRFFGLTPLLRKRIEYNFFILYFRPFFVFGYMHIPFGFSVPESAPT